MWIIITCSPTFHNVIQMRRAFQSFAAGTAALLVCIYVQTATEWKRREGSWPVFKGMVFTLVLWEAKPQTNFPHDISSPQDTGKSYLLVSLAAQAKPLA